VVGFHTGGDYGAAVFLQVCHGNHTSSLGHPDEDPNASRGEPCVEADVPGGLRALLAPLVGSAAIGGRAVDGWVDLFAARAEGGADARASRVAALLAVARAAGSLAVVGARGARLRAGVHLDSAPAAVLPRGATLRAAEVSVAKEGSWTWRVRCDAGWCTLKDALLAPDFADSVTRGAVLALPPPAPTGRLSVPWK